MRHYVCGLSLMSESPASPVSLSDPTGSAGNPSAIRWVLPATILGSSMGFIDGSVVNVALPAMQVSLHSTLSALQWVVNGYMLMLASLLLLGGSLGDRFGRRRMFIAGLVLFAAASLACGAATSAGWLVAARVVQGAGAALLVPTSLAIIGTAYGEEERGRALGTWSAAAAIMTAIGPPLGGWLVDAVGWRAIFLINPAIAVAAVGLALKLPVDRPVRVMRLDIGGSLLAVAMLALSSYGLIALGEGLHARGAVVLMAAIVAGGLFVLVEARSRQPMLPLGLFRNRDFAGANLLTVALYAALSGALFMLPVTLIRFDGYSATMAGAALLPFSIIMGAGSRWTGGLADRFGARLPLVGGPLLTACGLAWLALAEAPSYWISVFPGTALMGIGMTFAIPPLTSTIFNSVPPTASGVASGINNAAARGGGLLAVAAIGLAFGGADLSTAGPGVLRHAFQVVMLAAAGLAVLSGLCAAATIRGKPGRAGLPAK
jgi:EmrB/QacA subfamily drug resistance transporter